MKKKNIFDLALMHFTGTRYRISARTRRSSSHFFNYWRIFCRSESKNRRNSVETARWYINIGNCIIQIKVKIEDTIFNTDIVSEPAVKVPQTMSDSAL